MKACTLCLQTNVKVVQSKIVNSEAIKFIQNIFVNNGFQPINQHNYICLLCNYLLNKCYDFVQKTLRAQKVLQDLKKESTKITISTLQIERDKFDLDVKLACQKAVTYNILETQNELENICTIKSEDLGSETVITPVDFYKNETDEDFKDNYKEILDVNDENIYVDIKVDLEPYFPEVPISDTRVLRSNKSYKQIVDSDGDFELESDESSDEEPKPKKIGRKKTKKIVDNRIYPMKCDHCKCVIDNKTDHFHHYLLYHREIPYPYGREAKYVCQHCGVNKTSISHLREHELTHGERKLKCPDCSKLFHNSTQLKRHRLRHGAALMECDYCGKGFVTREDIILHIRTHTGVKPFKCIICDAAFAHRGNVAMHMRSRHQQEPEKKKKPDKKSIIQKKKKKKASKNRDVKSSSL